MVYRSQISIPILIALGILIGGICVLELIDGAWGGLIINLLVVVFITYIYTNTYYTIASNQLLVRCGFIINITIDIAKIRSIAETNSILSAPALSLDRLEIFYNTYDSVVISPSNKAEFIQALKSINNGIAVKLKEKNA